jgi:hypothetical protein
MSLKRPRDADDAVVVVGVAPPPAKKKQRCLLPSSTENDEEEDLIELLPLEILEGHVMPLVHVVRAMNAVIRGVFLSPSGEFPQDVLKACLVAVIDAWTVALALSATCKRLRALVVSWVARAYDLPVTADGGPFRAMIERAWPIDVVESRVKAPGDVLLGTVTALCEARRISDTDRDASLRLAGGACAPLPYSLVMFHALTVREPDRRVPDSHVLWDFELCDVERGRPKGKGMAARARRQRVLPSLYDGDDSKVMDRAITGLYAYSNDLAHGTGQVLLPHANVSRMAVLATAGYRAIRGHPTIFADIVFWYGAEDEARGQRGRLLHDVLELTFRGFFDRNGMISIRMHILSVVFELYDLVPADTLLGALMGRDSVPTASASSSSDDGDDDDDEDWDGACAFESRRHVRDVETRIIAWSVDGLRRMLEYRRLRKSTIPWYGRLPADLPDYAVFSDLADLYAVPPPPPPPPPRASGGGAVVIDLTADD